MESNAKENKKLFSIIGLAYLIGCLVIIALQVACIRVFNADNDMLGDYSFLVAILPMYIIGYPVLYFLVKRIPVTKQVEKNSISAGTMIKLFFIAYAGMYISNILGNILASIIGIFKKANVTNGLLEVATSNSIWMNLVVLVLLAPVIEEIFFRKLIIDRINQFGDKVAILVSAFMFALFHGNLYQFCYALVVGLILAYVYSKSGKLIYSTILHMCINFMGSVLGVIVLNVSGVGEIFNNIDPADSEALMQTLTDNMSGLMIFLAYVVFLIVIVITGIVLFFVNKKKIVLNEGEITIPKGEQFKTIACNIGMGLFIIFWIGYIIYATLV